MNIEEVEAKFGNLNQVCLALKIKAPNMTYWKRKGYIPWKQQFKIALLTDGELMPDEEDPSIVFAEKKVRKPRKTNKENNAIKI